VVEIDDRAVMQQLAQLEQRARSMAPVMPEVGNILVASAQLSFRDSADPWGNPWAPLSPVTLLRRAARRTGGNPYRRDGRLKKAAVQIIGSAKPLLDTGRLRNSITFRIDGNGVVVGTNLVQAGMQQFGARRGAFGRMSNGSPIPWGNVPARAFLPVHSPGGAVDLPLPVRRQIVEAMSRYLLGVR